MNKESNQNDLLSSIKDLVIKPGKGVPVAKTSLQGDIWILGAGKASVSMAESVIEDLGIPIKDGLIISPSHDYLEPIQVFKGSHPLPTEDTVAASYELLQLVQTIPAGDTVIFCLSGGASSLLTIPPFGIEIDELSFVYELLLESGAAIQEINIVRKHLCELKGGQLAQELHHVNLITLIISDVPGNDFGTIGSAPTLPDSSTYQDALDVLMKYDLWRKVPESVRNRIHMGLEGEIPETPKPGDREHPNHTVRLINSADAFAQHLKDHLSKQGFNVWIDLEAYNDEINSVVKHICSNVISVLSNNEPVHKPAALVFFGESSIKITQRGKGGRNQHLALACAIALEGQHDVTMISLGTDGIDGNTEAAGAIITSYTTLQARKKKLNPEEFLQKFDSYHFHKHMDTLIKTGPTGNNLMDLQVLIIQ